MASEKNIILKYVITDRSTGKKIYRLMQLSSGLMADADEEYILKYGNDIDDSNCRYLEVNNLERFTGYTLTGVNDFDTWCRLNHKLDLLNEYNTAKNPKATTAIGKSAIDKVWWICSKCGYEWQINIKSRTTGGRTQYGPSGCPSCHAIRGKATQLIVGVNDLETWCKENNALTLLKEYNDAENELPANSISCKCSKKVKWRCSRCNKIFESLVVNRTKNNSGCKFCTAGTASYPELILYLYLSEYFNDVEYRYKVNKLEIDIYLPEIDLGIDYRGVYWHSNREDYGIQKELEIDDLGINQLIIKESNDYRIQDRYIYVNGATKPIDMIKLVVKYINEVYSTGIIFDDKVYKLCEQKATAMKNSKEAINNITITNPEILKRWDYEKNGDFKPNTVTAGTKYKAWFKCPYCGTSYYNYIRKEIKRGRCKICKVDF